MLSGKVPNYPIEAIAVNHEKKIITLIKYKPRAPAGDIARSDPAGAIQG